MLYSGGPENEVIATTINLYNVKSIEELDRNSLRIIALGVCATLGEIQKSVSIIDKIAPEGVDLIIQIAAHLVEELSLDQKLVIVPKVLKGTRETIKSTP